MSLGDIGLAIDECRPGTEPQPEAARLVSRGEAVLEHWVTARGQEPTDRTHEGFRLIALHRQGARGEPSFNACRETVRELAYHYNLITLESAPLEGSPPEGPPPEGPPSQGKHDETAKRLEMMRMVARHLYLFVSGKMEVDGLGEFCCSSRPMRLESQSQA